MKVITLGKIVEFIEHKHGKQTVSIINIKDENIKSGVICIHDKGTICPEAYLNNNDELEFNNEHERVHCILLEPEVKDFNKEHPFIELEKALSGYLVVDGEIPSEEDLVGYIFRLDNHSAYGGSYKRL